MGQNFGGKWSLRKENTIKDYLNGYTTALKYRQYFDIIYIDAFAGTGTRSIKNDEDELSFLPEKQLEFDGTAKNALQTNHPFDKYIFVDSNKNHCRKLEELKTTFPTKNIEILNEDANNYVQNFCNNNDRNNYRAVIVLDPFGMEVNWETLKTITKTKSVDLWYLVSMPALFRNLPLQYIKFTTQKKIVLESMFGKVDWEEEFYKIKPQIDLLSSLPEMERDSGTLQFERFITNRLEKIFSFVGKPIRIMEGQKHKFSLYLALANNEPKAIALAKNLASNLLK